MQHTLSEPFTGSERKIEGKTTDFIERRTGRLPSGTYLSLAVGSMVAAAALMLSARRSRFGRIGRRADLANFVGQWAPCLLTIGVYNKVVKLEQEMLQREQRP